MQVAKVPLVYTMELPDYGEGFIMPVEKIKPMVRETYEAFKVFARYVCALRHINCKWIILSYSYIYLKNNRLFENMSSS